MKVLKKLHEQAMELSDQAFISKKKGDMALAKELIKKAFVAESKAASLLKDKLDVEPTRSIIYRSAATLAIECGKNTEAIRLVKRALKGNPPLEIQKELQDLEHKSIQNIKQKNDQKSFLVMLSLIDVAPRRKTEDEEERRLGHFNRFGERFNDKKRRKQAAKRRKKRGEDQVKLD